MKPAPNDPSPPALPPRRDIGFWAATTTQFLGAFNDNVFKQLVLLLCLDPRFAGKGSWITDQQGTATFFFSAPFLLFTGWAGYLADRYSKRRLIVICKVAEIFVMLLGLIALARLDQTKLAGLYVVLFLMGTHSAFFGPPKYGILPEALPDRDLPRANGIFLMTTFLAIIFGTALAGFLAQYFHDALWRASLVCMAIAVVGTLASLGVWRVRPARPELAWTFGALGVPREMRSLLAGDRPLLGALIATSVFWLVAALVPPAVNALGMKQLAVGETKTSFLTATIGAGIAAGCALGGLASGGKVSFRHVRIGGWGIIVCFLLLAYPGRGGHWLGYAGLFPTLFSLGIFTGFFAVPIQVFLQTRPPDGLKGRMIAVMNQANWVGVVAAGLLYQQVADELGRRNFASCWMFLFAAALMLPLMLFYRPRDEQLA